MPVIPTAAALANAAAIDETDEQGSPTESGHYDPGSDFRQSSGFGYRPDPINTDREEYHGGIDFSATRGTDIPAASDGEVVYSGLNRSLGNTVIIKSTGEDGDDYFTLYGHMQPADIPALGDEVSAGDIIGHVGSTGTRTTGPHLHFSVLDGDTPVRESGNGGPIGFRMSDEDYQIDPTTFSNWADESEDESVSLDNLMISTSGGEEGFNQTFSATPGTTYHVDFDPYVVADSLLITGSNITYIDTGLISDLYGTGPISRQFTIGQSLLLSVPVTVSVIGSEPDTVWDLAIHKV